MNSLLWREECCTSDDEVSNYVQRTKWTRGTSVLGLGLGLVFEADRV